MILYRSCLSQGFHFASISLQITYDLVLSHDYIKARNALTQSAFWERVFFEGTLIALAGELFLVEPPSNFARNDEPFGLFLQKTQKAFRDSVGGCGNESEVLCPPMLASICKSTQN